MPTSCRSCGVSIHAEQRVCSVCYGDPDYGRDGLLRAMMEADMQRQWEATEAERLAETEGSDAD